MFWRSGNLFHFICQKKWRLVPSIFGSVQICANLVILVTVIYGASNAIVKRFISDLRYKYSYALKGVMRHRIFVKSLFLYIKLLLLWLLLLKSWMEKWSCYKTSLEKKFKLKFFVILVIAQSSNWTLFFKERTINMCYFFLKIYVCFKVSWKYF